jgi:hypothetical protein
MPLLPLVLFQSLLFHLVAVSGIVLAIAGLPNVYAAPEFSGHPWERLAAASRRSPLR